jgi:uncharacterized phiE125 gp8 family phage protein
MGLSLVTAPTSEPLTLTEAKDHCRVDSNDDDGLIAGYILAARRWVEGQIHRAIMPQTWLYTIDWDWPMYRGEQQIVLPLPPLSAVNTISYVDLSGNTQTLGVGQYVVTTDRPKGTIFPAYDVTWPSVRDQRNAITVSFVTGEQNPPDELRHAILMLIGHFYENRESVIVGQTPADVPYSVEALISPFRVP